jgi:hypothetical protein
MYQHLFSGIVDKTRSGLIHKCERCTTEINTKTVNRFIPYLCDMSTHHQLVWNPEMVQEFDQLLNADLGQDRVRVAVLLARAKYLSEEDSGRVSHTELKNLHLTRQLVKCRGDLLRIVRHYEVPLEAFTCSSSDGKSRVPVPAGCVALYLTLRARSCLLAYQQFETEMTRIFSEAISTQNSSVAMEAATRVESEFKGAVHRAISSAAPHLLDLDVDTKEPALLDSLGRLFRECGVDAKLFAVVETRGGFHVVMDKSVVSDAMAKIHEFSRKTIFSDKDRNGKPITKRWMSVSGDGMIPVPGTLQGGFQVRLLSKEFRF